MIITDVRPRRKRLSLMFIDGEPAVKVDTEIWLRSGLAVGDEIDDMDLKKLLKDSATHRAHEKALYLLEHRAHSKKELAAKIARTEFDREAASAAADRMEELGLIDDEQYARRFAQELFERRGFGARRVQQELGRKGIDSEIISAVLEEFSPETDETVEKIREIVERKYAAAWEDEKVRRRAVAALQRYGYKMDDIFKVLNEDRFD